ncbi:PRC-barrel domain protein [Posidoniimonas corsicana]|uniref:PRC-barrel domain protein n=1 Tax=Posidoniimonas corsicana TaxID=1938618 RepID=A0A5C5UXB2_9BACT|nr:PRC-barrel domain-containing protein [Posidoniimonas corsicana]TWT30273.1 PRC-barrel domain protein [Posidoniimonas corsicana]
MSIKKWTSACITTAVGAALCAGSLAGDPATVAAQPDHQDATRRTANYGSTGTGSLDQTTAGHSIRASKLIGMAIENPAEEGVGEVSDIVLDARTGKIQYVAVTYGGFLGVGNKMFAVPYQAFRVKQDPDDPNDLDDRVLVLDVTQEKLEGAEGFDENHWPDTTDPTFTTRMNKRYGVMEDHMDRRVDDRNRSTTNRRGVTNPQRDE